MEKPDPEFPDNKPEDPNIHSREKRASFKKLSKFVYAVPLLLSTHSKSAKAFGPPPPDPSFGPAPP